MATSSGIPLRPSTINLASVDSCFLCEPVIQANEKPVQATTSERASLLLNTQQEIFVRRL